MKNIKEVSKMVANETNMPQKTVELIANSIFEEIADILTNKREEVRIKNFAVFKFGKIAGKTTKHPTTKELITIDDKTTVRLGLSTKMKRSLNA